MRAANFIAGEWTASVSGRTYDKRNPYRTSELVGAFPASGAEDVEAAVHAAGEARRAWAALPPQRRGEILFAAADAVHARAARIAADMTHEMGKPIREASAEVARGADQLRFYAGEGWRAQGEIFAQGATGNQIQVLHRPLGVVGLICPWNFPFSIPLWKTALTVRWPGVLFSHLGFIPWFGILSRLGFSERAQKYWLLSILLGRAARCR